MATVADTGHGGTRAYAFDGTNDRFDADVWDYDGTGDFPFSIAMWVKSEDDTRNCQWFGNYNESIYGISIDQYAGTLYLGMESLDGGYAALRRSVPCAFTAWTHVAMTYDGSGTAAGIKIYIAGELASSSAASPAVYGSYVKLRANDSPLRVGGRQYNHFFKGRLEDVMIFDAVKSAGDITAIYTAGPGYVPNMAVITLDGITTTSAASAPALAQSTVSLAGITTTSAAGASTNAQSTVSLDGITTASAATVGTNAQANITLDGITITSAADARVHAESTVTLDGVTIASAAATAINALTASTLDGITITATDNTTNHANIMLAGVSIAATSATTLDAGSSITLAGITTTSGDAVIGSSIHDLNLFPAELFQSDLFPADLCV